MKYRKLGNSELNISEVSFGCMSLDIAKESSEKLIHKAIDYGVNFFDTADLYDHGKNESFLGRALKNYRKDVIVATKVGNQWRTNKSGWDWNPSKSYIIDAVEESLRRLQTDYIDLYQLHGGTIDDPIDETIDAFETLKQQGKIRYYGISSIRPNVIKQYVKHSNIASVMMQYSLLDRRPEEECLSLLKENNIGVLTRGTLAKGVLAGKSAIEYLNHSLDDVGRITNMMQKVLREDNSMCQIAIQYVLKNKAISAAVVGIRTDKQLESCLIKHAHVELSEKDYFILQQSNKAWVYTAHR
ncbi:aldo/keto reductase [Aquimarina gracilis]|uniref:Aldo/keto reductase n=1 Tax=Aquimarina gracilis TaxID=874422 RepID=A0ABU5ZZT2_9FLAO|nr:aldo/keto reductase [Aquimarina gracilis]MEB3347347.1 aldo/keto reductase [Aquimarina gracilis]